MVQDIQFARGLYDNYELYREQCLYNRRFKYKNILRLIFGIRNKNIFTVKKTGESFEGRNIYLISLGHGPKKIFCWSQMHGDEPTATAAIFDIFNFFSAENSYTEFKEFILNTVTLHFMPMVNPDGAEVFQRRNILEIDLNRDALVRQSPESKILNDTFENIKPDFGFNLHDQERIYTAGISNRSTAISFHAPPFDYERTINESRTNSMKLIVQLSSLLNEFIPGHIAKYDDNYEPRAYGDNFAKTGTSIVLMESGAWTEDRERQFLRKLNFISLLMAFKSIAEETYQLENPDAYKLIPFNEELMIDFIIRNVKIIKDEKEIIADIGINYEEINLKDNKDFFFKAMIKDLGDLSVFTGFRELDADGLTLHPGKTSEQSFHSFEELNNVNPIELFENNCTNVKVDIETTEFEYSPYPFNVVLKNHAVNSNQIKVEALPNFILRKEGKFKYAVVNGFLYDANLIQLGGGNGLIIK